MSRSQRKANKADRKNQRLRQRYQDHVEQLQDTRPDFTPHRDKGPLQAQSEDQAHYIIAIEEAELVFGTGPAGTGKTYVAAALAAEKLLSGEIEKIYITRPAKEVEEESMGFLPGELDEKYAPFLGPYLDAFYDRMGKGQTQYLLKSKKIEAVPLSHMRGRTFRDAIVILDEAQNATPKTMKMFLTRIGKNSSVIVNGDINQSDINGVSGLEDAIMKLRNLRRVRVVELTQVVRSGLVQDIVEAYEGKTRR